MPSLTIENAKPNGATIHDFAPTIPAEAIQIKTSALAKAAEITKVDDDKQLALAVNALRSVKDIIKEVGLTRKALDAPFSAICKDLRQKEQEFIAELEKERDRLLGISNNYEQRKLRAKEDEARVEAARVAEAARKVEEARQEADRLAKQAETAKGASKAVLDAKALEAAMAAEEAAMDAGPAQVIVPVAKVAGFASREVVDFEVTDVFAFVTAYPEFFKWSADTENLKLMRRELSEEVNKPAPNRFTSCPFPGELPNGPDKLPRPPGIRLFKTMRSRTS